MSSIPRWLLRRTNFETNRNVVHRHSLSIPRFGIDAKDTSSHSFWPMYIRVLVPALSSFYFFIFLSSRFPSSCASCHFFSASTCKCSYRSRVMVRSLSIVTSYVMIYHNFWLSLQAPISVIGCFFNVGSVQSKCSDVTSLIIFLNLGPKKDFSVLLQESKRQLSAGRLKCRRYRSKA